MEGKIITVGNDVVQETKATDSRPTLTDAQVEKAITKIKADQGDLEALKAHYKITDEQEHYVRAQTEVLDHDSV